MKTLLVIMMLSVNSIDTNVYPLHPGDQPINWSSRTSSDADNWGRYRREQRWVRSYSRHGLFSRRTWHRYYSQPTHKSYAPRSCGCP